MADRPVLVFDVNETLLDLDSVAPVFDRIFGDASVLREWFAQLILYSEALSLAGEYAGFGELGGAVLRMIGRTRDVPIGPSDLASVREAVASMPAHPDVRPALLRLRDAGFRMVTLTNNPKATCEAQLERAGLLELLERRFSIDDAPRRYKPAPETYREVEQALGLPPERLWMIACHTWDTLGAAAVGWQAALVLRSGNAPLPVGPQPALVGSDLGEIADALIGAE